MFPHVCKPAGSGFSDSLLIYFCLPESSCFCLNWSLKDRQKTEREKERCVWLCVTVCVCVQPVQLMLMMINSTDMYLWKVQCLLSLCLILCVPFFSTSLHLLSLSTSVSLPISYIISGIIIPPLTSEPTHSHLPARVCALRVRERVLCLKSLNILKTKTSFNYPLITLLITCHTHIHHWPDCTHMHAYTHPYSVHSHLSLGRVLNLSTKQGEGKQRGERARNYTVQWGVTDEDLVLTLC